MKTKGVFVKRIKKQGYIADGDIISAILGCCLDNDNNKAKIKELE